MTCSENQSKKYNAMTTKELIANVAAATGLTQKESGRLLDVTLEVMTEELLKGTSVHVKNFGVLEVRERKPRVSVHPKTGERLQVPAKRQMGFKLNSVLKEELN